MAYEFKTRRLVEFADTDMAGITHFSSFFRYMEEAEHAFFRSLGLSIVFEEKGRTVSWPRVASSCEFFSPVRFEDEIDVHLWVSRKGRTSLTHIATFSKNGTLVARGKMTAVCCTRNKNGTLRRIPIPAFIGKKIEQAPFAEPFVEKEEASRKQLRKTRTKKRSK